MTNTDIDDAPVDPNELFNKARRLYFDKRFDEALRVVDRLLASGGNDVRAYCIRALCYVEMGLAGEALEAAEAAVRHGPADGVAYSTRAFCRHRGGDRDGAELDYSRALELEPGNYKVHYNLACYWSERGDEEKCRDYLRRAIDLAPPGCDFYIETDGDLARYAQKEWFRELLLQAKVKARASN